LKIHCISKSNAGNASSKQEAKGEEQDRTGKKEWARGAKGAKVKEQHSGFQRGPPP
jgi:hypothetical protein